MIRPSVLVLAVISGLLLAGGGGTAGAAGHDPGALQDDGDPSLLAVTYRRHHRHASAAPGDAAAPTQSIPVYGAGQDPRPNGGVAFSSLGYSNYTRGSAGGFGGYPPGSDGANELMNNQRVKCQFAPETC